MKGAWRRRRSIEEGGVVHGGRGPSRGLRGIGGRRCATGKSGRPGRGLEGGEKGLVAGQSLGLHEGPGGAARRNLKEILDAEASLGAAWSLRLSASARGQGGSAAVRSETSPVVASAARTTRERERRLLLSWAKAQNDNE